MYKLQYDHLMNFSSTEGYWSTLDCLKVAEDILSITNTKYMLEIGFNIGYSASTWLKAGITDLYVIDINMHKDTQAALEATKNAYPNCNMEWLLANSLHTEAKNWEIPKVDIAFIDGEHSYEASLSDSYLSMEKGAKWLVYDDVIENHTNGIDKAISVLEEQGIIEVVNAWPMTWTEKGYVVLAKVL